LEAQGVDVIHLEIGELDFDTPTHIVEAGVASMRAGRTRYGPTEGTIELREAIAAYVSRTRETSVEPQHVVVTPGVKGALFFAIMSLIEAGDEVIIPDPGFPAYPAITRFVGGSPISLPLRVENGFQPDPMELRSLITDRTKLIILNSPGNPTGAIFSRTALEAIAEIVIQHGLWVISDEIYGQLTFLGQRTPSIFEVPGLASQTILTDGFSKAYAMTGWRLGFGVFPEALIKPVWSMMVNDHSCLPLFVQDAGVAALSGSQDSITFIISELRQRRDMAVAALNELPSISCPNPDGAFYALMDISELGDMTDKELTEQLLEAGVALLPGSLLGEHGDRFVRLAFTVTTARLATALDRIRSTFAFLE
jgi:aspartate/methionine/tyrosine aminotransferase